MRIGIYIGALSNLAGIGRYVFYLLNELMCVDPVNYYKLYRPSDICIDNLFRPLPANFSCQNLFHKRKKLHALWYLGICPNLNNIFHDIDIFHSPDIANFPIIKKKLIVTIHDLAWKKFPAFYPFRTRRVCDLMLKRTIKKADHLIAISKSTKNDLVDYLNIDEEKITVVYEGCDIGRFKPLQITDEIRNSYNIKGNYILSLGDINPRKNIERLIKAFAILDNHVKRNYCLVLAGNKGYKFKELQNLINYLKLENKVITTGYIRDDDLPMLISGADLFVYPSLYEGFGLPILEAMACGTPVITSNISSMPEIAGKAAILADPYNVEEIADAIKRVLSSTNLQSSLINAGFLRSNEFSLEKMAKETLAAYKKCLNN